MFFEEKLREDWNVVGDDSDSGDNDDEDDNAVARRRWVKREDEDTVLSSNLFNMVAILYY